jgi:PTH1 family peptidyl-tRNA hydrolase
MLYYTVYRVNCQLICVGFLDMRCGSIYSISMALFQKKPMSTSSAPLYTLGLQKNLIIVGLGNPGAEYDGTRHNIGFHCLDELARTLDFPTWTTKKDMKAQVTSQTIADTRVILVKPTTFMNLSGEAAQAIGHFYKIAGEKFVVVHDELDIEFGQIRLRLGGSAAGHNGIQSLIDTIGADFGRVRIGIHNPLADKAEGKDFVLGKFNAKEQKLMPNLIRETNAVLSELIHGQPLAAETRSFLI